MKSNSRNPLFILLACVSAGVLGYFIWIFLAPLETTPPTAEKFSTEVKSDVVQSQGFRVLKPYAQLPIVPTNVGRANPFLPIYNSNANAGGTNASNANGPARNVNGG